MSQPTATPTSPATVNEEASQGLETSLPPPPGMKSAAMEKRRVEDEKDVAMDVGGKSLGTGAVCEEPLEEGEVPAAALSEPQAIQPVEVTQSDKGQPSQTVDVPKSSKLTVESQPSQTDAPLPPPTLPAPQAQATGPPPSTGEPAKQATPPTLPEPTPTAAPPQQSTIPPLQGVFPAPKPPQPSQIILLRPPMKLTPQKETNLPPPPTRPFLPLLQKQSLLSPPKFQSVAQSRPKFAFTTKAQPKSPKNSRAAFLTAALSPSFVSAKPLHTRTHTTISEIVGNLAPERYLSLPPRSPAAAKALIATLVCKELRDVHKLETIRKRHGDVAGGGWFDYVLDSLGTANRLKDVVERLKHLTMPRWEGLTDRMEFLPMESLRLDSVLGNDFSELWTKGGEHLKLSKVRPIEGPEVRIGRMKHAIKVHTMKNSKKALDDRKVVATVQMTPAPVDDLIDDDLQPPLSTSGHDTGNVKLAAQVSAAVGNPDIIMVDDDSPPPQSNETKPKVQLPVSLVFDDATGKVSIDWEIREISPKQVSPTKAPATMSATPPKKQSTAPAPMMPPKSKNPIQIPTAQHTNPQVQVQAATSAVSIAPRIRVSAPASNLDALLNEVDEDIIPLTQPDKTPDSDPEVVLIDAAKDVSAPRPAVRRTKRKRVDRTQDRAIETEQRASRMRSAVVSALQEDPEARRQRAQRSSTANGHAKPKKKVSFTGRRMSRRVKKNTAPILDSSGSDKEFRRELDDDFTINAKDVIEVLPVPKTNGTRPLAPNPSPSTPRPPPPSLRREPLSGLTEIESLDGSDMISPPLGTEGRTRSSLKRSSKLGSSKHSRHHKSGSSSSKRERHREYDDETHEGEPELWNREILRVERLLEENENDTDPLLNEIDYNPYRFYEQVPILRRVIQASKSQHGHLMDMDKVDEYDEMAKFYHSTRNDPTFGSGVGCPGTEFLENVFEQTERERLSAMSGNATEAAVGTAFNVLREERFDLGEAAKRNTGVVNLDGNDAPASSPSEGSSDSSAESSEGDDDIIVGGSKRSRSTARSRASKARELQSRVCGDLLATMTHEAKRRVLRWAERDFSWFDRGADVMEIVASRTFKRCTRCETREDEDENCEESILLKLWKDMSWRKVRRMRHRSSGGN